MSSPTLTIDRSALDQREISSALLRLICDEALAVHDLDREPSALAGLINHNTSPGVMLNFGTVYVTSSNTAQPMITILMEDFESWGKLTDLLAFINVLIAQDKIEAVTNGFPGMAAA